MRWLVLILLASCWTASIPEPAQPRDLRVRHVLHVKPTCWTPRWYAEQPDNADQDIAACYGADSVDNWEYCMMQAYSRAYERQSYWVSRWFESCDPGR